MRNHQPNKRRQTELIFDSDNRRKFVTGFHERKKERQNKALNQIKEKARFDKKRLKKEVNESVRQRFEEVVNFRNKLFEDYEGNEEEITTIMDLKESIKNTAATAPQCHTRLLKSNFYQTDGFVTISTQPLELSIIDEHVPPVNSPKITKNTSNEQKEKNCSSRYSKRPSTNKIKRNKCIKRKN